MAILMPNDTAMDESNDSYSYGSGMGGQYGDEYMYGNDSDYGPYDYYTEGDIIPHHYKIIANWEIAFRGYITFLIAFVVIVSNAIMLMVFVRSTKPSHTTAVLGALAVSDIIICLTRLPEAFHFNILGNYEDYVPYRWCIVNHALYIIYQMFRFCSNWITALLGCQRCMCVCMPLKFQRICTIRNTALAVGIILLVSVLLNVYEMIAINISELKVYTTLDFNVSLPSGCSRSFSESIAKNESDQNKSQMFFYIFSGLLYRLLPVVILCVTTIILAYFLWKNPMTGKNKGAQYKRITISIFIIMIVFLIAEIQDGIAFIIYAYESSTDKLGQILSEDADIMWDTVSSVLSLLGYACNFWIFFFMSKPFRDALIEILRRPCTKIKAHTKFTMDSEDKSVSTSGKTNSSTYNESTAI